MANGLPKRSLRKGATGFFITDEEIIIDKPGGKLAIVCTAVSGGIWQMRWYIGDGETDSKSLRTRDRAEAKALAIERYGMLKAQLDRGEPIRSPTAETLVQKYLGEEKKRIVKGGRRRGGITAGRFSTIQTTITRHFLSFVGKKTRLDRITPELFKGYYAYRYEKAPKVTNSTLKNERSMITTALSFAAKKGFIRRDFSPEFPSTYGKPERRDAFSVDQWVKVYQYLQKWHRGVTDPKQVYQRQLVRLNILIGMSTGLRPGNELDMLKWRMIELSKTKFDSKKTVGISVPEDTKTGQRKVQALGGELFEELRHLTGRTGPDDWVFAYRDGVQLEEKVKNDLFRLMLRETGLDELGRNFKPYSLRHTYCTFRLLEKTPVQILAKNMGVSIKYISDHYDHVHVDMMIEELTRDTALQRAMQEGDYGVNFRAFSLAWLPTSQYGSIPNLKVEVTPVNDPHADVTKPQRKAAKRK